MDNTLFISGIFRSGTTLLCRALSVNARVHVSYQPYTPLFRAALNVFWASVNMAPRPMADPALIENLLDAFTDTVLDLPMDGDRRAILDREVTEALSTDRDEKDGFQTSCFTRADGNTMGDILANAMSAMRIHAGLDEDGIAGVKEIWCEEFFPALMARGSKCIHVVRDPRGCIASRNYGVYMDKGAGGQRYPILFIVRAWRRSMALAERLSGHPGYRLVRFEDLVRKPEQTLAGLCEFLGVSFTEDMLDLNRYRGGDGKPWRGNVDSSTFSRIDPSQADKWSSVISDDDAFLCEYLCGEEMRWAGYALSTDPNDANRFRSMTEDSLAAGSWLCDFGHCLNEDQVYIEMKRRGHDES